MEKPNFYDLTLEQLTETLKGLKKEGFRAQQLYKWIYQLNTTDFAQMTNLSKEFRQEVPQILDFHLPEVITELTSLDGTKKFLFRVGENKSVEAVLIPSPGRLTLCVSSEVGCNMACKFCYTAKQKLQRKLHAWEIVGQYIQAQRRLPEGQRISNIVFMGMGEPLDNPEHVFRAIEILHNSSGINLSRKKITVSTSGLVPQIPLVTKAGVRLAVSLNAVNNETRTQIMPINKKYPLEMLLEACRTHARESGDKITMEYVLLKGVTDSIQDARDLVKILRNVPSKVNIIPFNEHPNSGFHRPSEEAIVAFHKELMRLGVHVLRRKTMGRDIYAACGQLTSVQKDHPVQMSI